MAPRRGALHFCLWRPTGAADGCGRRFPHGSTSWKAGKPRHRAGKGMLGARTVGCYLGQWPETGGRSCWRKRPGRPERPTGGLGTRWAGLEGLGVLDSPSVVGDGDGAVLEGDVHTGGAGPPGVLEEFVEAFRRGGVEEPGDLLDGVLVDGCPDFLGQGWGAHVCVLLWRCCAGFTAATRFSGGLSVFFCADVPIFPCSPEHGPLPPGAGFWCGSGF